MSDDNIVSLYPTNFRDVPATLRNIANEIESGKYGEVGSCAVTLLGNTFEVFGMGADAEGPSIGILLNAGVLRITKAIEGHGK